REIGRLGEEEDGAEGVLRSPIRRSEVAIGLRTRSARGPERHRILGQTENDSPQAHSWTACGLFTLNPPPSMASLNSRMDPATMGRLLLSTRIFSPWASNTASPSARAGSRES